MLRTKCKRLAASLRRFDCIGLFPHFGSAVLSLILTLFAIAALHAGFRRRRTKGSAAIPMIAT